MILYDELIKKNEKLSVVGLGYVGLPLAVAFAEKVDVIGLDLNEEKVAQYNRGIDVTREVGNQAIKDCNMVFTSDATELKKAKFHVVAVPTPVKSDRTPDLSPLEGASCLVGQNLVKGSIIVFESTVYPGVTEEVCVPILEKESGLKCGVDFKVGYSPERINPSDKVHVLSTIVKVVAGMDDETLEIIAKTYELVALAGVHKAKSIKVAEAAKVIENSQRDINIAFMNELSVIFNKMDIDTKAVLEAAGTKWNFLNFTPGLVGGHCIGVDPYYLTYKAKQLGYHSKIILAGRTINDDMGRYIAENVVKSLSEQGIMIKGAKVAVLGFTFKENCQDTRNTKVIDIINELNEYGVGAIVSDPVADRDEAKHEYGIEIVDVKRLPKVDAVLVCVGHEEFKNFEVEQFDALFADEKKVLFDIKGMYDKDTFISNGYDYWRL